MLFAFKSRNQDFLSLRHTDSPVVQLAKCAVIYLWRSRILFLGLHLIPMVMILLAVIVRQFYAFNLLTIRLVTIFNTIILVSLTYFDLNNSHFFKKIIIKHGVRARYNLVFGIVILFLQLVVSALFVLYAHLLYFLFNGNVVRFFHAKGFFLNLYTNWLRIVMSIFIGIFIAYLFKSRIVVFCFTFFLTFFLFVFSSIEVITSKKWFYYLEMINPFRSFAFYDHETFASRNFFNIYQPHFFRTFLKNTGFYEVAIAAPKQPTPPNIKEIWQVIDLDQVKLALNVFFEIPDFTKYDVIDKLIVMISQQNTQINNTQKVIWIVVADLPNKLLNIIIPYVFLIMFTLLIVKMDPLKRTKHG